MNDLIKQEYFQNTLNQFISMDEDLIRWKLTCTNCLLYKHDIHIQSDVCNIESSIFNHLNVVDLNLSKFYDTEEDEDSEGANCCIVYYIHPNFDKNLFDVLQLSKLTHLTLGYNTFDKIVDSDIANFTSLIYLDVGVYSRFSNNAFKKLNKLEILYLNDNVTVTSNVFKYLPKLHTLYISDESDIKINNTPDYVINIFEIIYDYVCERCDIYHVKMKTEKIR